jgi:hypothetical protein
VHVSVREGFKEGGVGGFHAVKLREGGRGGGGGGARFTWATVKKY